MKAPIEVDPERFRAIAQLLTEYPDLDIERVRSLLDSHTGRRRRAEPVRPKSWSEITAAVEAGWLTKNEARKAAGLRQRTGPVRKSKEVADG